VCQGQVWVQARSIIPLKTLQGKGRRLRFLGSRSLGSLLFNGGQRQEMCILPANRQRAYWTRRSRFRYVGKLLLVQETFLPTLFVAFHQHKITL
jgi:chorismate--pyruvate lyase